MLSLLFGQSLKRYGSPGHSHLISLVELLLLCQSPQVLSVDHKLKDKIDSLNVLISCDIHRLQIRIILPVGRSLPLWLCSNFLPFGKHLLLWLCSEHIEIRQVLLPLHVHQKDSDLTVRDPLKVYALQQRFE